MKFIQGYQARGIPIDAITPMNEPDSLASWPGADLSMSDQTTWLPQDLAPALRDANLHPRIYGVDEGAPSLTDAQTLLDSPAGADLTGVAYHCYDGMANLSALHYEYPREQTLLNECSPGIIPYAPAEVAIDATRNWASGAQLWNLALDPSGGPVEQPNYGCASCTGIITVNEQTRTAIYGQSFYELGQVSRYVQPGAIRIFSTRLVSDFQGPSGYGVTPGVDDVAFLNPDDSTVLVAYNSTPNPEPLAVESGGRYLNWTMPGGSTVTITWH